MSEKTERLALEYPTAKDTPDGPSQLSALAKRLDLVIPKFYTPSIIAAEQSRESGSYGVMGTADEIKSVVVPKNGLLLIGFQGMWKQSVAEKARAALFIGETQLKIGVDESGTATTVAAMVAGTEWARLTSGLPGLLSSPGAGTGSQEDVETGQVMGFWDANNTKIEIAGNTKILTATAFGGFAVITKLKAGTYNISVRYKSAEGKVSVKQRRLDAVVFGNE